MFCGQDLSLLGYRDMGIYFRNIDRTMTKHFLNITNIDISF